ncbi:MAG: hypothetical protein FVQ85_01135 [Planctomycetes bacterium]|nr:hypothetical protein [Planctomycetota bacterium]
MLKYAKTSLLSLILIAFSAGSISAQSQLVGDVDGNYRVNSIDLRTLALQWLNQVCLYSVCKGDLDGVDGVNWSDFALLANNWQIVEPHIIISEFMASNNNILLDKDGDSSDWIEIYNPTDTAVNLDGWSLTDNKSNLTMWQFPAVDLDPGQFLVIFASEKNILDPNELHTNFELNKEGDYLALVANDGNIIVHEYTTEFPTQLADISYGLAQYGATLVPTGATANYHVPTIGDAALGTDWTDVIFNDSAWDTGKTGLGFGVGGASKVAYNDVIYSSGQYIASNVTQYGVGSGNPGPTYGPLLDQATGNNMGITAALSQFGGVGWTSSSSTGGSDCAVGTDAYNTFGGFADMTGVLTYGSAGWWVDLVFTGLDPTTQYTFATSSNRGNPSYTDRLGIYTLIGADTFTNASTIGVDVLAENKVRFNTGYNYDAGYVARWTDITAADGSFAIRAEADASSPEGRKAYSFDVFKLEGGFSGTDVEGDMLGVNSSLWARIDFFLEEEDIGAFDTLKLQMKYEDGFVAYLNGVEVANYNAPSPVQWDSTANSNRPIGESMVSKSINIMSHLGLLQPKPEKNVLAIHGLNDNKNDGEFLILPELTAARNQAVPQYFTTPTPGTFNIAGAIGIASEVWFSHKSRNFAASFQLILSTAMNDAEIRYTLDGSLPTITNGTIYSTPLTISGTTNLRAVAVKPGWLDSPVETQAYIFLEPDVRDFSSNLPIAIVDTFGGSIGQTTHRFNFVGFIDTTTGGRARITDLPEFIGRAGINIRGKSSTGFPKKQYHLETWDEYDQDKDVSILGFPAESDWILQGPYSDKSLMRNFLSYKWSNDMGRYAVRSRFIELFLNTNGGGILLSDYVGVYVLMERIKLNKNRVDIAKLDSNNNTEPEITGGYIIKKDKIDSGEPSFYTSTGQQLLYFEPKWTEITQAQKDWIKGYLDEFETVLYGLNFTDPVNGYAKYIEVDSFLDIHILVELTKNIDGFRLSTYMFKDRGGKLNMGPAWDYNLSLGNADYLQGWIPQGWYYSQLGNGAYPWWRRLFEDPEFRLRYADRWFGLRKKLFTTDQLLGTVDNTAALLNEAQARNFNRWSILGTYVWPNWYIASTYQQEINWMKGWLSDRLTWMDSQIGTEFAAAPPVFNQQGGQVNPGFNLTMTASSGTIYYTIDGSDPREPLTGNPVGTPYAPVTLNKSTHVKARARDGITWSALNEAIFAIGPAATNLRITEIMYNPQNTSDPNDPNTEYIELKNIGTSTLNLNLVRFTEGIDFTFPDIELGSNEHIVVVKDQSAFEAKYGTSVNTAGPYIGSLANNGERIKLVDAIGLTILDFEFKDGWRPMTNGDGFSLTVIDPGDSAIYGSEGLVAHWKFDDGSGGTATDSAGTNNGALVGDPTWTAGRINGALSLDGNGDYVVVAPVAPLAGVNLTAQAWIRVDEFAGIWNPILTQHDPSNNGYYFYVSSGTPAFYIVGGVAFVQVISNEAINTNQWYHVAGTNDGSNLKLYIDGQLKDSASSTGFLGANYNAYIGSEPVTPLYYTGLIDDVRIYNRAVSESEFQNIADPSGRWSQKSSWRASVYRNGTPGWDDSGILPDPGAVVINEVMSHSNAGPDWIELYNTTGAPINIGGWFLSDNDRDEPNLMKYRIANGTMIAANSYLVFYQDTDFNNPGDPGSLVHFAFSENGEEACLSSHQDPNGMLTGYRDVEDFGAAQTNVSFGRYYKSSTDNFNFVAMDYNTPDANNPYPKVGPVVINEIMYNPPTGNQNEEYIELHNITGAPVTLYRVDKFTPWKFTDGIDYTFSDSPPITIPANGYLMVVKDLAAFIARYGSMAPGVQVLGYYNGRLSNAGERLQIGMPGDIDGFGARQYIRIDRVTYSDGLHPEDVPGGVDLWPTEADGLGKSLSRKVSTDYGNDVANWEAATPSPGAVNP